jgi:hypothetical protein
VSLSNFIISSAKVEFPRKLVFTGGKLSFDHVIYFISIGIWFWIIGGKGLLRLDW